MKRSKIPLGSTIWGDDMNIVKYEIGQGKPFVYIQGGIHGGEVTYWIFHELNNILAKSKVIKKITLVPVSNPFSWSQTNYYYTSGKYSNYDGKDFNRNFPGNRNGSRSERLAQVLYDEASKHEYCIDLHTANKCEPHLIVGRREDLNVSKVMNFTHTFLFDFENISKLASGEPLSFSLLKDVKQSFAMECGSHDVYEVELVNLCLQSILNFLISVGAVESEMKIENKKRFYSDKLVKYLAPTTGFIKYIAPLRKPYKKEDLLFQVYPSNNLNKTVNVYAKEDGFLAMQSPTHIVYSGDYVIETIPQDNIHDLIN